MWKNRVKEYPITDCIYLLLPYFASLLKAGTFIYGYKDGVMHAKIVLIDYEVATIGTENMGIRSFELNYELIAVLYESKTVLDIKSDFEHFIEIRGDSFHKQSIQKRILESFMRLSSLLL
ncbi:hypothetical protein COD78_28375 [Bacillus cereus]|nr:hypothetical protein CN454_28810 [Bacillus cereus]PGV18311.1 hypothetical protein COD78_28375 [Bacillus cereus]